MLVLFAATAAAQGPVADVRTAILEADDARVQSQPHRDAVAAALRHESPEIRVPALRAIGRTQRPEFLAAAIDALSHPSLDVRREAAFAVAHIGSGGPGVVASAGDALRAALAREEDALVVASLAEELGRLPLTSADAIGETAQALQAVYQRLGRQGSGVPPIAALGIARGVEALARRAARLNVDAAPVLGLASQLFQHNQPAAVSMRAPQATPRPPDPLRARIRRLSLAAIMTRERPSPQVFDEAAQDPDPQVRRLAVIALSQRPTLTEAMARTWVSDQAFLVRHAAVSRLGPRWPALAEAALSDAQVNVRLAALDALGEAKACRDACMARLDRPGVVEPSDWHEAAHALVALARTDAATARPHVVRASGSTIWQVRMYAARAAGLTGQADQLARLAADAHVNVRHAALVAWREAGLPDLLDAARSALSSDDGQLVLEAATTLKGSAGDRATVLALREALRRLTAQRRETSRDPRLALLARIDELDPDRVETLRAYLPDFDPLVAERAATAINARLSRDTPRVAAAPDRRGLDVVRAPSAAEIATLDGAVLTLALDGGRRLVIRLFAQIAPTAVARLVAQVRAGEWNGRTFHRVEPGFVVQGGSPAANEYAGAAAFARDEFSSLAHVRGTVGISTRGPDTGDGQIFVNLVDNARLDYAYTIIGSITSDHAVLDDILEGEAIERATLELPRR